MGDEVSRMYNKEGYNISREIQRLGTDCSVLERIESVMVRA